MELCALSSLNRAEEITSQFSALTQSPWNGEDGKSLLWVATKWNISEHLFLTGLKKQRKQRKGGCWLWKSWMNVWRAVILVVLVIKIKWGPYGKCTFPRNVLGQMQVFRGDLRGWGWGVGWQRIQSHNRDRVRGGMRPKKTHFALAEEITFRDIWGSL